MLGMDMDMDMLDMDMDMDLYSTSSSIMSINEHAGHGHGHGHAGHGYGHGGQHQQNANRSVLGSMLQIDDIFGNSFPSSTSINDHTHHALLNGSSNNSNVNANVNVNVHNSSSNNNNSGNSNGNNNSNSSIQSNAFSNDNISVSTGTASVSSVQVNRASNCNSNSNSNIDANLNGMYYSNGGNGPTQNQNQNHGHVNGHVNGHSNSNGNNNVQMYVSTNETDDKNSISGSTCNTNNNTSNGVISTDVPVKYKICMGRQSSSFTITLLVPVPVPTKANNGSDNANANSNANSNVSPFQKVVSPEDNSTFHDNNGEVSQAFALRIPLSYLIQQQQHQQQQEASNAESGADPAGSSSLSLPLSSPLISKEAPWLDRTVIRNRINDGGRAIGLEPTFAFQAAIAVEETASKLPQWLFPLQSSLQSAEAGAGTGTEAIAIEAVSVEIILSEGIATLVASATATATANANRGAGAGNSNNNGLNLNNSATATATATSPPKSGLDSSFGGAYVNMNGGIISHPSGSNNSSPLHQPSSSISMDRNSNYSPLAVGQRSNQVNQVVATSPINGLGLGSVSASASCGGASPSPRQHYNVLNEKGVGLLATAPSFPPPGMGPSRPRPTPNHSNGNGNGNGHGHGNHRNGSSNGHANGNMHMNGSNINSRNVNVNVHAGNDNNGSFPVFRTSPTENQVSGELYFNNVDHGNGNGNGNHMNTSMNMNSNHGGNNGSNTNNGNVFNSQLLGSSLGSWTSYSGQHQRPAGLSSSFQGPSSTISMMNSFGMPSSRASAASANGNNNNIIGRGMHNGNDIKNTMHLSSSFPSYNYGDMIMREHQRNNNHRSINSNNNSSAINIDRNNLNINHNHNGVSTNRPNPSMIIGPLLNMGFSKQECEAAAVAIHRHQSHETIHKNNNNTASSLGNMLANHHNQHQHNNYHDNNNNFRRGHIDDASLNNINRNLNQNQQESDSGVVNALNNMSLVRNPNLGTNNHRQNGIGSSINISNTSNVKHHHHQSTHQGNMQESLVNGSSSSSVWGNAGKMKMIKTPTNNMEGSVDTDDGTIDSGDKVTMNHMANIQMGGPGNNPITLMQQKQQPQQQEEKMIRVLDIPPDLNAFVFHCNSQTRDECLERGLFGCPSGGQYGPHSKAKKGDLLFLADFSAWTVTGIFTAKTDAGLNLEKSAWGGRFPWQIKVNTWSELRTVHIDKINEIIGLASGSKLNMLTKDQLMQLVTSTEFGPNVPDHLFKMKRKVSV
eukprot:CAMPEP_0203685356 /NCGR_PEP_ID=MMETSP0090-20130426/48504_1 /ASSEMBLY_ACC=CAM_ASM_001088 /TAXON_ID=426623 /ORGANISM="Chaetoceros affinis, Strain CCMP159" /LENGTH=1241 /DNA_ID=CAMNT_0050554547 /DNA_START=495 /DNA_END=4220 /DNA_ORIENTATION=-